LIRRLALIAALLSTHIAGAQAPIVRLDDAGPGLGPSILAGALARPHTVVPPGPDPYVVGRTSTAPRSLVVLGRDVLVEGHVNGDVIVVDGDLYMHPGGVVDGRAMAFGGGVYESTFGVIRGDRRAFRAFTYDISPVDGGWSLRYRPLLPDAQGGWSLPGVFGITMPLYDRSNGVSLGVAPRYAGPGTSLVLTPRVTYRSQLGEVDPSLRVEYAPDRRTQIVAIAERSTLSNDRWIRGDLLNSAQFLYDGNDARNYYRASYADARIDRHWESVHGDVAPYVGARFERSQSVRPGPLATGGPWTLFDRDDDGRDDRLRENPAIDAGDIASGLLGAVWTWSDDRFHSRLGVDGEVGRFSSRDLLPSVGDRATFGQATIDGTVEFATFADQTLLVAGHFVASTTGNTPRQRFAYVGGPGTIPTRALLEDGGNQLVFVDARYRIPVKWFTLPYLGAPTVTIREILAGADVDRFPDIHQAIGGRLSLKFAYVELLVNPENGQSRGGIGLSLSP